jgi:hypothetical protein
LKNHPEVEPDVVKEIKTQNGSKKPEIEKPEIKVKVSKVLEVKVSKVNPEESENKVNKELVKFTMAEARFEAAK